MSRRTDKIARSIQAHLAELINYHLSDPRVQMMVTVSAVEVSPDLGEARVRVTALTDDDAQLRTLERALRHAAGKLRSLLGERMALRAVPRLDLRIDRQAIRARQTIQAIEQAMRQDSPDRADAPPDDAPAGAADHSQETPAP